MLKRTSPCLANSEVSSCARALAVSFAALALVACRAPEACERLGTCGGDIVGSTDHNGDGIADRTWDIAGSCTNQVSSDPPNTSLINQPTTPAGTRPPQPEYINWCSEIVIDQTKKITKAIPWYPALPIRDGSITYAADGTFSLHIDYAADQTTEFAAGCFEAQGFQVLPAGSTSTANAFTCAEFGAALKDFYVDEPNITGVACGDDGQLGCACIYNLLIVTGANGTYTIDGSVIHHYDVTKVPESDADYCVINDQLQLSGHDRQFLFNQSNVRSLVLSGE
ncbi:MAG TPA: hypothetical protein VHV51_11030 [Polyangiaceae bacterium]|nr:hypothetical protein [Polyangiaceae bacterium]